MTQRSRRRLAKSEIGTVSAEEDAFIRGLVLHEDGDILVFNKPSGLAVQGGSGVKMDLDRLLWAFANRKGRRPKLVHRLDRETSGVTVVAKTSPAAAHLSAQFAARSTEKIYLALASGQPESKSGTIEVPLIRITSNGIDLMRPALAHETDAQAAITDWRVVSGGASCSLLEAIPHTGRMHQIRAHLAHLGHPIAGDTKYGGLLCFGAIMIPRLMLHARELRFIHPTSDERVSFNAPLPSDYNDIMAALGMT